MDDINKKAEPIDAQDGEDFTKELASRDDYGEASHRGDPSEAYHDYLGDSANFSGFPLPVNQQELWNRFKDWADNRKNKKLKEDKDKVGKERQPESIGEGYWSYKNTPYVAPTGQRAEFMAMPAQKEGSLERIIMAEEMKDDSEVSNPAPSPLFEDTTPSEVKEAPKVDTPKGPALEKEKQEPIVPLEEFWSGLHTGLYVTAKAGPLDTPARVGDRTTINGDVAFDAEGIKASYPWEAFAIKILDDQDPPSNNACRLEINVKPIMKLVASAVQKYKDRGMPLKGAGYYSKIKEAIPAIFEKIFQAIKQNSKQIEWKGASSKHDKDAVTATVTLRGMDDVDASTGFGLEALMDKSAIVSVGTEILRGGSNKGKPGKSVPPTLKNMDMVRDFVKKIPENKFEWKTTGMYATMTLAEIKALAGEDANKLIAAMDAMPEAEKGARAFGDLDDFWCEYSPEKGFATFENKRLSNKVYLQKLQKVYKDFGGGSREQVAKNIAKALGVSEEVTESWLTKLLKRFTPQAQAKVNEALGIKVVAYPTQPWAGPSLEQVGALVGPDKAMLASEWASSLADKLNYISYPPFPTLVGGPGDIKKTAAVRIKLATLTLSDEQRALVEEYSEPALAIMHSLLAQYPAYEEDEEGNPSSVMPDEDEITMLAEDALINLVENVEGNEKPDKEDFLNELKKHLWTTMKRIQERPRASWPSNAVGEGDVQNYKERSYDPVADQPEVLMQKRANVLLEESSVEVIPDHPHSDPSFHGKKGKVLIAQPDFHMSDENGPESIMCYLVSFEPGQERWFTDGEVRPTN